MARLRGGLLQLSEAETFKQLEVMETDGSSVSSYFIERSPGAKHSAGKTETAHCFQQPSVASAPIQCDGSDPVRPRLEHLLSPVQRFLSTDGHLELLALR